MREAVREFTLATPASDLDLTTISQPGLDLKPDGPAVTRRRAWLDTFDWRLYRAGLSLERSGSGGGARLILTRLDGTLLATAPGRRVRTAAGTETTAARGGPAARPLFADELPPGPLREHVARLVTVRALLPVARAASVVTRWRAVGADGEPAALVDVDKISVSWPRRARCPARLAVIPVGGDEPAADRLAGLIAAVRGADRGSGGALTAVLHASGGHPSRRGKPAITLARSMPGTIAVAAVLTALLDALEANVPGTLGDVDTEFLHDLRIAVRHTRSVLKLAAAALPSPLASQYGREFQWLGQLTGPTRDLDVFLLGYLRLESALSDSPAADLRPFREHLERLRASARRDLCQGLRSARFARLSLGWRRALAEAGGAGWPIGSPPAATLAATQLARAHRRVLREGRGLGPASGPEELHELRKRSKELRYLADVYASLYKPAAHARAVASLKKLQDCLGEVQDTDTQQREIGRFAGQLTATGQAPAGTLAALREIGDILAARQQRARDQFARRFAEFSGDHDRAAFLALTERREPVAAAG